MKCDEANGLGTYQCVEFANRYLTEVDHKAALHGNATDLCSIASHESGLSVFSPGGSWGHAAAGHKPVAGDLLVWSGGSEGFGHVAVVASTTSSQINYVQQNWGWFESGHWGQASRSATAWSGSFFGQPGASGSNNHPPKCWIHAGDASPPRSDCVQGGLYCGGDKLHGDANTLYRCKADGTGAVEQSCAHGCKVNSGQDDSCKPAPAPPPHPSDCVKGGLYCGGDKLSGDSDKLYECKADGTGAVVKSCAYGCKVNSGTDDSCKARASDCVTGGYYCGGDKLHGDSSTLYECKADGTGAVVRHCSNGCRVRSGEDDACR